MCYSTPYWLGYPASTLPPEAVGLATNCSINSICGDAEKNDPDICTPLAFQRGSIVEEPGKAISKWVGVKQAMACGTACSKNESCHVWVMSYLHPAAPQESPKETKHMKS